MGRVALLKPVIVNLKSGLAIEGVLVRTRRRTLELRNCELLEPGKAKVPADGVVLVDRANVEFVQAPKG